MTNTQLITTLLLIATPIILGFTGAIWLVLRNQRAAKTDGSGNESEHFTRLQAAHESQSTELERVRTELETLRITLQNAVEERGRALQKIEDLKEEEATKEERMRQEFGTLARSIIDENSERHTKVLNEKGKATLNEVLTPIQKRFEELQLQMQKFYGDEREQLGQLDKELEKLFTLNEKIQTDAKNLTAALKGDSKVQGDWGEYQLERILEQVGLQSGVHYSKQSSVRNEEGHLLRPDFLIHLPDDKVLVIDSKVSLTAYERMVHATDPEELSAQRKLHATSMRNHIRELGQKNYAQLYGKSTDYTLMFVPIEAAWMALGEELPDLQSEGLRKHVLLVSTSTLIATLRTISYVWKQEEQQANVRLIAKRGGSLYDQLTRFVESLLEVGKKLDQAQSSYDIALKRLQTGKGSAIRQAEMMRELGVPVTRPLPEDALQVGEWTPDETPQETSTPDA